ncbi:MAG: ribonuclease III [Proteobacteria bacterium]|nr:ribonuclease III [Pseudomonadota bacterium]
MNETKDLANLEYRLNYSFKNIKLLENALRHSSFVNEHSDLSLTDNERLEFLGDAVLNLVIGHLLMNSFPSLHEGDLSRMRANMVNESQLAMIARDIDLGFYLKLGKGEIQTNGQDKNSILSDAFEAVVAAVYIDGGFQNAFDIVARQFSEFLLSSDPLKQSYDSKSRLQELVQTSKRPMPEYRVAQETGPDHDKTFIIQLTIGDIETSGAGKSKKTAEQEAAMKALEILENQSDVET